MGQQVPDNVGQVQLTTNQDDWSEFQVEVYRDKNSSYPIDTYRYVVSRTIGDGIKTVKKGDSEEIYVNPGGNIDVTIEDTSGRGVKRIVTLRASE